ncbi:L,D-transpeptidase family protein [Arenibaculum pallidiluteum]|uniref:L,D-transpeptidase family protein n=1 Tax=Arenibaculum pallidiluteum TaxID=2812559 RepID=UPI001A973F2E|nr:L,D-transpeptidase family protein [Arenibaculum pallidiluteum]
MKRVLTVVLAGLAIGTQFSAAASVAAPTPAVAGAAVRPAAVADGALAGRLAAPGPLAVEGRALAHGDSVRRFYTERKGQAAWTGPSGLTAQGAAVVAALQDAAAEGLDPADYLPASIKARLVPATAERRVELELLISDALMSYAVHLRSGRLDPAGLDEAFAVAPVALDPVAAAQAIATAPDATAKLAALAPPHLDYAALRKALAVYREAVAAGRGWPAAGPGPILKPGMQDASVPALRRRLASTGEFAGADLDSDIYDEELEAAVKLFQARTGLGDDGVVGVRTRAQLNVSLERRIQQIVVNMERLRWLPDRLGDRHVIVNQPDYSLKAVEGGAVKLQMPVIVGSAVRQTPILASRIGHLVFNPTWTVPETIAREDILPKAIKDPGFFIRENITIREGWGEDAMVVNPYDVDWKRVGKGITRYRLRQEAGPTNPLGTVKFMFPNAFDVYLHDTPQRGKFTRDVRTLSSGCVRVGDPDALTAFLFSGMADWPAERIQQVRDAGQTRTVYLRRPVPVYLTYQTVVPDPESGVQFRPDIYDRDQLMIQALAKRHAGSLKVAAVPATTPAMVPAATPAKATSP